jgi:O-succinylbenzoic acid--CoA ligase
LVLVGGGRVQTDLFKKALALGWPVCATYGMTEAASQVASQPLDHNRLIDPETLEVLPHWHTQTTSNNSLIIQGPSLAKGYVTVTDSKSVWESINPANGLQTSDHVRLRIDGTRTFLAINYGTAGFSARRDAIVEITGFSGNLSQLQVF